MTTVTRDNISRDNISQEPLLQQVASVVSLLQKAVKIVCLYPACNPTCAKTIELFSNELDSFLQTNERLLLYLAEDGFTFEGESVEPTFGDSHRLSKVCYDAGVSEIEFSPGFSNESADEIFDIFRKVITKDEGDIELGEALWGKLIPGFSVEIIEDQSYIEFDSELQREFFGNQSKSLESGYLSEHDAGKKSYAATFANSTDDENADSLVRLTSEQVSRFETVVTTLSDDTPGENTSRAYQDDAASRPRDLMMRVYELDSRESHETALALAKDAMFNSDEEIIGLLDDLLEQDKRLKEFTDTVLTCIKAHSYFVERGALKRATTILRKLQIRRSALHESQTNWEMVINEALSAASSRERFSSVCEILNNDKRITADDFAEYLSTFDWTAYSTLTEALSELERKEHRLALCDYLAGAKPEHVDLIASGLYDKRWFVARNTAMILSNFNCAKSHRHLMKAMQNTDSRVRMEVVRGCQNHESSFKSSILQAAIVDPDPQIRQDAIEIALGQSGNEALPLFSALLDKLLSGEISESSGGQVILGFSQAGGEQAVAKLAKIAGDWRLIGRSPLQRFRAQAIQALRDNASEEATDTLRNLSKSWCREIKTLSQEALQARENTRREES